MYRLFFWRHHECAIEDQGICYGRIALRVFSAMMFVLATGGWTAPVAVVATPATPTDGATFNITWLTSCETPPAEAVTALDYAADLWGTWISSTVPIAATVCWRPDLNGGDVLGTGVPARYVSNFSGAPLVNTFYPIALANAFNGSDLDPTRVDMALQFKSDVTWSFVLTPTHLTAPADGEDFVTIALHELAHGLGFAGNMVVEYNIGFCGNSMSTLFCPTIYDQFAVDSAGIPLFDYLTPDPRELGMRLKSDANFSGPNAVAANAGTTAKLYAPGWWEIGSSLSHLDQDTFQSSANDLMTPYYDVGAIRHPGPVTMGIFQDIGWLRTDGVPNVTTSGPLVVGAGQAVTLTGDLVWPSYTGQPITYTWTAADQITVTHPGLAVTDSLTFIWDTPGEKRIALAVTDGAASAHATRSALVLGVTATGPEQGDTNKAYTFNANLSAVLSTPITYTWEATDKTVLIHANIYQTSDSAAFTWTMPGTKTITITVATAGVTTRDVHEIAIEGLVLDKLIFLPLVLRQS